MSAFPPETGTGGPDVAELRAMAAAAIRAAGPPARPPGYRPCFPPEVAVAAEEAERQLHALAARGESLPSPQRSEPAVARSDLRHGLLGRAAGRVRSWLGSRARGVLAVAGMAVVAAIGAGAWRARPAAVAGAASLASPPPLPALTSTAAAIVPVAASEAAAASAPAVEPSPPPVLAPPPVRAAKATRKPTGAPSAAPAPPPATVEGVPEAQGKPTTVQGAPAAQEKQGVAMSGQLERQVDELVRGALAGTESRGEVSRDVVEELPALTREEIVATMKTVRPLVKDCYRQHGQRGVAQVRVQVGDGGEVIAAAVVNMFASSPTGACIEEAVESVRFPGSAGLTFLYPFPVR